MAILSASKLGIGIRHSGSIGILLFAAAAAVLPGCAPLKRSFQPEQDHNAMNDVAFVHYLAGLPMVNMDEAYHAMLLIADGHDSGGSFEARHDALVERGIARDSWGLDADDALDKGTLGYMLVKVLKLEGGLNDLVLGSWGPGDRRYALRTAVWKGIVVYGPPHYVVSGGELVTALTNADKYMELTGMYVAQ